MREKTITAIVKDIQYKCHSVYGNPSYYVHIRDEKGYDFWGYTGSNCAIGYGISGYNPCLYYEFTYHITKAGHRVFTNWRIVKHADCIDSHDI